MKNVKLLYEDNHQYIENKSATIAYETETEIFKNIESEKQQIKHPLMLIASTIYFLVALLIFVASFVIIGNVLWELAKLFINGMNFLWLGAMLFMLIAGSYGAYVGYHMFHVLYSRFQVAYSHQDYSLLLNKLIEEGEISIAQIVDIKKSKTEGGYVVHFIYSTKHSSHNVGKSMIFGDHNLEENDKVYILHTNFVSVIL